MYFVKSIATSAVIAASFIGSGCTFEATKQVTEQKVVIQEPDIVKYAIGLKDPSDPKGTIDDYVRRGRSHKDARAVFPEHTKDEYQRIKALALERLAKYPEIKIEDNEDNDRYLHVSSTKSDFEKVFLTKLTYDLADDADESFRNNPRVYNWYVSRRIVVPEGIEDIVRWIEINKVMRIFR